MSVHGESPNSSLNSLSNPLHRAQERSDPRRRAVSPTKESFLADIPTEDDGNGDLPPLPKERHLHGIRSLRVTKDVARHLFHIAGSQTRRDDLKSKFDYYHKGGDAFDVLGKIFRFQQANIENQRDNAISMLASRLSRAVNPSSPGLLSDGDIRGVLKIYHGEMTFNYMRWCGYMTTPPATFRSLFVSPSGVEIDSAGKDRARALEVALFLLIWGEAANLRLCPEFLCFLYHKMCTLATTVISARQDVQVPRYLEDMIRPAYKLLAEEVKGLGHGAIDHTRVRNYDDFNEIFWRKSCFKLDISTMFDKEDKGELNKRFRKTFMERQTWLVPIFAFWRVHTFLIVLLHIMIQVALCQEVDPELYCNAVRFCSPAITIYALSFVKDVWDLSQEFILFANQLGRDDSFAQVVLIAIRTAIKFGTTLGLLILYGIATGDEGTEVDRGYFTATAIITFLVAVGAEAVMLTRLWWGYKPMGDFEQAGERNRCSRGGWQACLRPGCVRVGWSIIGSLCGISAVNLYTQIHTLPSMRKRLQYTLFWMVVLASKIAFSYFAVVTRLTIASSALYREAEQVEYDFQFFTFTDENNLGFITAIWVGSGLIYFLDIQIWFVLWSTVASVVGGIFRRVGELTSGSDVVRAFSTLHKKFFKYLGDSYEARSEVKFSHVWNEIVDTMREEDILSNHERQQMRYFLMQLRTPHVPKGTTRETYKDFKRDIQLAKGWGPLVPLLPEFLITGSVQRTLQALQRFNSQADGILNQIKIVEAKVKREEGKNPGNTNQTRNSGTGLLQRLRGELAREQGKFIKEHENEETVLMLQQFSASLLVIMDSLCRDEGVSRAMWNLHRVMFAPDVWVHGPKGGNLPQPHVKAFKYLHEASKVHLLFKINEFPSVVNALIELVGDMLEHDMTREWMLGHRLAWEASVTDKLQKLANSMESILDTEPTLSTRGDRNANKMLEVLQDVRESIRKWLGRPKDKHIAIGAWSLVHDSLPFVKRTHIFLSSPANSEPGRVKAVEARRRIKFFVNSLYIVQPKPDGGVLRMPSMCTLTPYYNEDVVLSLVSLKEETQDGVTTLEYLRSIYPDEWDNFVERMSLKYARGLNVVEELEKLINNVDLNREQGQAKFVKMVGKIVNQRLQEQGQETVNTDTLLLQLQLWASYRGQTLSRTVRGIMYYSQAVRLLAAVEGRWVAGQDCVGIEKNQQFCKGEEFQSPFAGRKFEGEIVDTRAQQQDPKLLKVVDDAMAQAAAMKVAQIDLNGDNGEKESPGTSARQSMFTLKNSKGANRSSHWADQAGRPFASPMMNDYDRQEINEGRHRRFWSRTSTRNREKDSGLGHQIFPSQSGFDAMEAGSLDVELIDFLETDSPSPVHPRQRPSHQAPAPQAATQPRTESRQGEDKHRRGSRHPELPDKETGAARLPSSKRSGLTSTKTIPLKGLAQAIYKTQQQLEDNMVMPWDDPAVTSYEGGYAQVINPGLEKDSMEYRRTAELAEAKYRYVVSCQVFSKMQTSKKHADRTKAKDITMLARFYPGLRIAYVEEKNGEHFSVLAKYSYDKRAMAEEYRVKLPGHILVGEGKPCNQNHAIIFTRGEAIQAIDMNQDASLEDAIKLRQLMEEFKFAQRGTVRGDNLGRIVGFREHVFTHDVSAVANFFSLQELNFVSATQRVLDEPLHIRFHYGHPDLFDRVTAITMGGVSKASKGIHLSEDIFAGFNYVLRGGESTQADYIQVAKGRDTGVSQVTGFTAKVSMGNGMQCRSREVTRLASQLDFFRLMSFYFSSVGGFMNQVLIMVAIYMYVYSKLYIVFSPEFLDAVEENVNIIQGISSQFLVQLGFLLILPIPLVLSLEQGFTKAMATLFNILLRLSPLFFIFASGTNAYYVNTAIETGQAKYTATGRGFVIAHEAFVKMFMMYLKSHFYPAFELLIVLIIYGTFSTEGYFLETFSVYLLVIGMLYTPVIFNPNGLDFAYASRDLSEWLEWMNSPVDDPDKSWIAWVSKEQETSLPFSQIILISLRRARYLILVYGFLTAVRYVSISDSNENVFDWRGRSMLAFYLVVFTLVLMGFSWIRMRRRRKKQLKRFTTRWGRVSKVFGLLGSLMVVCIGVILGVITFSEVFFFLMAALIIVFYVSQVVVLFVPEAIKDVGVVKGTFKVVHLGIGLLIMAPVLLLSFFPLFVDLQTRMLFSVDFSQRFNTAKMFTREKTRHVVKKNT